METMSNLQVVVMGIGTVFVALIAIIFISKIMSFFCVKLVKTNVQQETKPAVVTPPAQKSFEISDKKQFVAAVSAVIAEELGCSVEGIRIHSIKKI